jgi:hypothetical protein
LIPLDGGSTASNSPACIWIITSIPADASQLTFAFTASGQCANDSLVFGVNDAILFSLSLKYLSAGQTYSSTPIDMSAYTGTSTNQLFFGVLGGTSTNANVQINDVQFISFTSPSLSISQSSGAVALSWPSSANGYTLQSSSSLTTANWSDVTNIPSLFAGVFTVTNSWSDQVRFFRLRAE